MIIDISDYALHRLQLLFVLSYLFHLSKNIQRNFLPANNVSPLCAMVPDLSMLHVEENVQVMQRSYNIIIHCLSPASNLQVHPYINVIGSIAPVKDLSPLWY